MSSGEWQPFCLCLNVLSRYFLFQVLLVASSFMNPMESRNSSNPTRVRIFSEEKLSKAAIGEKWDRIRVVCTQPFNKVSYLYRDHSGHGLIQWEKTLHCSLLPLTMIELHHWWANQNQFLPFMLFINTFSSYFYCISALVMLNLF